MKLMNPMYLHIIESFACTRKMLAIMFLFPQISFISSGTCSAPKLLKFHFCYKIKQSMCVYICIFIKVYYVCPIFNCFRKIILVHSDCFHNQLLQFLFHFCRSSKKDDQNLALTISFHAKMFPN